MDEYGRFLVKGFKGAVMIYDGENIQADSLRNESYWESDSERIQAQPKVSPTIWSPGEITFETIPPHGWQISISRSERGTGVKPFVASVAQVHEVELRGPPSGETDFQLLTRKSGTKDEIELRDSGAILRLVFKDSQGSVDFVHNSFKASKAEEWCDTITNIVASHRKIHSLKSPAFTQLAKKVLGDPTARVDVKFGPDFEETCSSCPVVFKFTGTELLAGVKSGAKSNGVSRRKWRFRLDSSPEIRGEDDHGNVTSFIMHAVALMPIDVTIAKSTVLCRALLADANAVAPILISIPQPFSTNQDSPVAQFVHSFFSILSEYSTDAESNVRGYTSPQLASTSERTFITQGDSKLFVQKVPIFMSDVLEEPHPAASTYLEGNSLERDSSPRQSTSLAACNGECQSSRQELIIHSSSSQSSTSTKSQSILDSLFKSLQETEFFTRQILESQSLEMLFTLQKAANNSGGPFSQPKSSAKLLPTNISSIGQEDNVDPHWKDARAKVGALLKVKKHIEVVQIMTQLHERERRILVHRR